MRLDRDLVRMRLLAMTRCKLVNRLSGGCIAALGELAYVLACRPPICEWMCLHQPFYFMSRLPMLSALSVAASMDSNILALTVLQYDLVRVAVVPHVLITLIRT